MGSVPIRSYTLLQKKHNTWFRGSRAPRMGPVSDPHGAAGHILGSREPLNQALRSFWRGLYLYLVYLVFNLQIELNGPGLSEYHMQKSFKQQDRDGDGYLTLEGRNTLTWCSIFHFTFYRLLL